MKDRIKEIRNYYKLSQEQFGARIGITRASVSQIEKGTNGASNATLLNICREFNINKDWLETGNGNMFLELSRAEMAANIVGNAIASGDDFSLSCSLVDIVVCSLYAYSFYGIRCFSYSSCVDEAEWDAIDIDNVFNTVPCRSVDVGDDCLVFL